MPGYDEWAEWHATHLGIPSNIQPRELATWTGILVEWCDIFQESGYTPGEMMEASHEIVRTALRLNTVADHRAAMHLILMKNRAIAVRREPAAGEVDWGTCTLCSNTGFVIVPHLKGVKKGRWEWGPGYNRRLTCAVLCSCEKGRRMKSGGHPSLTLEQYERDNPEWHEQVELDRRERQAQIEAGPRTESVRESLRRLVDKWNPPRE